MAPTYYTVLYWPKAGIYTVTPSRQVYAQSGKRRLPVVVRRKLRLMGALKLAARLNALGRDGASRNRAHGAGMGPVATSRPDS